MANVSTRASKYPRNTTRRDYKDFFPHKNYLKGYLELADENFKLEDPPVVFEYVRNKGNRTNAGPKPINRKLPDILYDDSTTYRQTHREIPPPYDADQQWRAKIYQPTCEPAQGILPMQFGNPYPNPYEELKRTPNLESEGIHAMREQLKGIRAEERKYDRGIPQANTSIIPEHHVEPSTEYLDRFGTNKSAEDGSGTQLPDILPVQKRTHKYHNSSAKFSYNRKHDNQAY